MNIETADIIALRQDENKKINILLGKRCNEKNFSGKYCIPGGHIKSNESVVDGAVRELKEETNLDISSIKNNLKLMNFNKPDPNVDWKKSYGALFAIALPINFKYELKPQPEEMSEVRWYEIDQIPYDEMAFDHGEKIKNIVDSINFKISNSNL